jgi:hypothetical protein
MSELQKLNERLNKIERVVGALYTEAKKASAKKTKEDDWKMKKEKNPKAHLGEKKGKDEDMEELSPKEKIKKPGGSKFPLKPSGKQDKKESAEEALDREISELLEKKKAGKSGKTGGFKSPFGNGQTKGEKNYNPPLEGIKGDKNYKAINKGVK